MFRRLITSQWRGTGPWGTRRRLAALAAAAVLAPAALLTAAPGSASVASATTVPAPSAGWTTAYSDNFAGPAGSGVDRSWTYDTGTQYHGAGCAADYGTGEAETNTSSPANVSQDGRGHLNITAVDAGGAWTSGRIETAADSYAAPAGGEMEVTASIRQPGPAGGTGYWPAFWMLGSGFRARGAGSAGTMNCANWPATGEIDIMEDVDALSEVSGTLHCGTDPGGPCDEPGGLGSGLTACPGCQSGYETYSVIVNRTDPANESITYYRGGRAYHTVTESQVGAAAWQAAVDHGFFIVLDLALGGGYPNSACGCSSPTSATSSGAAMSVGYVAVYTTPGPGSGSGSVGGSGSLGGSGSGSGGRTSCTATATADISADCYSASLGRIDVTATADASPAGVDGSQAAQLVSGDSLTYGNVDFGRGGSTRFDARIASGAATGVSGLVEVVLDNPAGPPVGSFAVGNTGGWSSWETVPANISPVAGTHTVYLEFSSQAGGGPPFVSLHYFGFPAG